MDSKNESTCKQKDIIVFTDELGLCGIERVLTELTQEWVAKGHRVTVVFIKKGNNERAIFRWSELVEMIGIPISGNTVGVYFHLAKKYIDILKRRPDAIAVSLSVKTNFALAFTSFFVSNKVVFSDRNDPTKRPNGFIKQYIRNLAFKQADVLILQTEDVKKYYQTKIKRNGVVIPNPINKELSNYCFVNGNRRPVIVTACRLNKQKNLGMLLNAFSKLVQDHDEYTLEIFGRGKEEKALKRIVSELAISDKVVFKGFSNNIYSDISDCSIYVCSSDYEGISNSLLEALGLGIPSISTDCPVGGSRMLIENDVNGILINVGDVDALYKQMKRIIEHPELAKRLSENAIKVRDKYGAERIAQLWIDSM